MKKFYLYIFLLFIIIISISYFNTFSETIYKESFNFKKKNYILLGDSILKNNNYVESGNSLEDLMYKNTNYKTICLAEDDSEIINIYSQVEKILPIYNSNLSTIFLSVGGNDLLKYYNESNLDLIDNLFIKYENLIKFIIKKFDNINIVLLDIYFPTDNSIIKYHSIINIWNTKLYNFALNSSDKIISIIKLSNILTSPSDFTCKYEPSESGSKKILQTILLY
jgi:hypothetical protein